MPANCHSFPIVVNIDTTAPNLPSLTSIGGDTSLPYVTSLTGITLTGSAEANSTIELRSSTGVLIATGITNGSGEYSIDLPSYLIEGTYSYILTSTDTANNTSTGLTAQLRVDRTAPVAPTYTHTASPSSTGAISFSGTAESGSTIRITVGT